MFNHFIFIHYFHAPFFLFFLLLFFSIKNFTKQFRFPCIFFCLYVSSLLLQCKFYDLHDSFSQVDAIVNTLVRKLIIYQYGRGEKVKFILLLFKVAVSEESLPEHPFFRLLFLYLYILITLANVTMRKILRHFYRLYLDEVNREKKGMNVIIN